MVTAAQILDACGRVVQAAAANLTHLLLSAGSPFSLLSLAIAFGLAMLFLARQRWARGRKARLGLLLRALFPRRALRTAFGQVELGLFLFNVLVFGMLFGWATLSYQTVGVAVRGAMVEAFGPARTVHVGPLRPALLAAVLFVAYEFGFWLDHYTSHKIPLFWRFHRLHHTAEVLTPLTNFRVHPVEGIKFANILALVMGLAYGLASYGLGEAARPLEFAGRNIFLLPFVLCVVHLQHSRLWIAFTGVWGKLLVSPAHHQIHHSDNPAHYGKNLGSYLAVFDWMFGTLRVPQPTREPIRFGLGAQPARRPAPRATLYEADARL